MLEETLVIWGTEFGRTPDTGNGDGRDHLETAFTIWMAGGGIKGGTLYGRTDEIGKTVVENKTTVHDLHATILHLLGLDHERLVYRFGGRDESPDRRPRPRRPRDPGLTPGLAGRPPSSIAYAPPPSPPGRQHPGTDRQHAAGAGPAPDSSRIGRGPVEAGVPEPLLQRQGPDRLRHAETGAGRGPDPPGKDGHRRAHQREHRHRSGHGVGRHGIPVDPDHARHHVPGTKARPPGHGRRTGPDPRDPRNDRRHRQGGRVGEPPSRRLHAAAVQQSGQSPGFTAAPRPGRSWKPRTAGWMRSWPASARAAPSPASARF